MASSSLGEGALRYPRPAGVPLVRPPFETMTTSQLRHFLTEHDAQLPTELTSSSNAVAQRKILTQACDKLHADMRQKGWISLFPRGDLKGKCIDIPPEPPRGQRTATDIKREIFLRAGALENPELMAKMDMNTVVQIQNELNLTREEMAAYYEDDAKEHVRPPFNASKFKKTLGRLSAASTLGAVNVADAKKVWLTCREDEYMESAYDAGVVGVAGHVFGLLAAASTQAKNAPSAMDVRYYLAFGVAEILLNRDVRTKLSKNVGHLTTLVEHIAEGFEWCVTSSVARSKRISLLLVYAKFLADLAGSDENNEISAYIAQSQAISKGLVACAVDEDAEVRTKMGGPVMSPLIEHGARCVHNLLISHVPVPGKISEAFVGATFRSNAVRRCPNALQLKHMLSGNKATHDAVPEVSASLPATFYTAPQARRACSFCKKPEKPAEPFKVCARCKNARYCDATCQKQHWRSHKSKCTASS